MISFVALFSSIRISRKISALSASSSCELAMDKPSPLTCFRIVSSLALPNRFLDGLGDSEPLFVVPLFVVLDCAPPLLPLNLCGNVLDFSHGRDWSLFASAYADKFIKFSIYFWLIFDWMWHFFFVCRILIELTSGFFSAWARRLANVFAISSIIDAIPVDARPFQNIYSMYYYIYLTNFLLLLNNFVTFIWLTFRFFIIHIIDES